MNAISRRTALLGAAGAAAALPLALSGCAAPRTERRLALACGEPGGVYLDFGELLSAELARDGHPPLRLRETFGSGENASLLAAGAVDLALALADTAELPGPDVTAIGRVYQNYLQCVVRSDSGIAELADLGGTAVSIGAPGSGASLTTRRLLEVQGLGPAQAGTRARELPIGEAIAELAAGRISALFWSGGLPTPLLAELTETTPLALVDLGDALPGLAARYPDRYLTTRIPSGVYPGTGATTTIGIPNYLLARPSLPDATAAALVGVLIDRAEALVPGGAVGIQFLTPASLIETGEIPLHPGAAAEYRRRYG